MTRWLPVPGYEGVYEVSEQGEIRRYGKERRTTVDKKGYVRITLSKNGKVRNFLVSALVCKAFHGPRPEGCEALISTAIKRTTEPTISAGRRTPKTLRISFYTEQIRQVSEIQTPKSTARSFNKCGSGTNPAVQSTA